MIFIVLKVLYVVVSFFLLLLQVFIHLNLLPSYRRILRALARMHARALKHYIKHCIDDIEHNSESKTYIYGVSSIKKGENGFKDLINIISWKGLLPKGIEVLEVRLYYGEMPIKYYGEEVPIPSRAKMSRPNARIEDKISQVVEDIFLRPNAMVCVTSRDERGVFIKLIIFHPFNPELTLEELRD